MAHEALFAAVAAGDVEALAREVDELSAHGEGPSLGALRSADGYTLVTWAAQHAQTAVLRWLHERGVDVRASDSKNRSAAHLAAGFGHEEVLRVLHTELGVELERSRAGKRTSIHFAAIGGSVGSLRTLAALGVDLEARADDGMTPADLARAWGHPTAVEALAELAAARAEAHEPLFAAVAEARLADVQDALTAVVSAWVQRKGPAMGALRNAEGHTLATWATQHRRDDVLLVLKARGVDLNAPNSRGAAPMHVAAWNGDRHMLQALADLGADFDVRTRNGKTPVHVAAQNGQVGALKQLAALGANMNATADHGRTAVHLAARLNRRRVLVALAQRGAAVDSPDAFGETPLDLATRHGHASAVQALQAWDARPAPSERSSPNVGVGLPPSRHAPVFDAVAVGDLDELQRARASRAGELPLGELTDEDGHTLATWAALHDQPHVLAWLREKGVDLSASNAAGETPLRTAASNGKMAALRWLCGPGRFDPAATCDGSGLAHWAAARGQVTVLGFAIKRGVDVKRPDQNGFTPLHHAAARGHGSCVEMLCRYGGADPEHRTPGGDEAVHLASRHGRTEVLRVLCRDWGANMVRPNARGLTPVQLAAIGGHTTMLTSMCLEGQPMPMPDHWPDGTDEAAARQCLSAAAVGAAIESLEKDADSGSRALAADLTCPVSGQPFGIEGSSRPVRWEDQGAGIVMSAAAVTRILDGDSPRHPYSRRNLSWWECLALRASQAFRAGDPDRMAMLRAVQDLMLAGGPAAGRCARLVAAAQAAVPSGADTEWGRLMARNPGPGTGPPHRSCTLS